MISLRTLFSKYRIAWIDRGPNCTRGNINIACPLCGNADRSYHLAIREDTGQFWCFRNPKHHGPNITFILAKLKIPSKEYAGLKLADEPIAIYEDTRDYSEFQYFTPAEENEEALDYLSSRLFSDPVLICQTFKLKVSSEGRWAGRLIIPLTVGWTGRAMRDHLTLRYDAWTNESAFFLYRQRSSSSLIVEGAIDAMRVASVSSQFDVIGKCRIALSPALLAYLRETNYASIFNSPDDKVPYSQYRLETATIRSYCTKTEVNSFLLPNGRKDFGMTPETETRRLLSSLGAERIPV